MGGECFTRALPKLLFSKSCRTNQWTGLYVVGTSVMKELYFDCLTT